MAQALHSIRLQRELSVEAIVVSDKPAPPADISDCLGAVQQHPVLWLHFRPAIHSVGAYLNCGLRAVRGQGVYITDSDIVFRSPRFIADGWAHCLREGHALIRPPMRRLLQEDKETFRAWVDSTGLVDSLPRLDTSQSYLAKTSKRERRLHVLTKHENGRDKTFLADGPSFDTYCGPPKKQGEEPRYWTQERHCGGILAPYRLITAAGGYCEQFISWGCYDADLQWKLNELCGTQYFPDDDGNEVIHIDHDRPYFSHEKWQHDRGLQSERRARGAVVCIAADRTENSE